MVVRADWNYPRFVDLLKSWVPLSMWGTFGVPGHWVWDWFLSSAFFWDSIQFFTLGLISTMSILCSLGSGPVWPLFLLGWPPSFSPTFLLSCCPSMELDHHLGLIIVGMLIGPEDVSQLPMTILNINQNESWSRVVSEHSRVNILFN